MIRANGSVGSSVDQPLDLKIAEAIDPGPLPKLRKDVFECGMTIREKFIHDVLRAGFDLCRGPANLLQKRKGRRAVFAKLKQTPAISIAKCLPEITGRVNVSRSELDAFVKTPGEIVRGHRSEAIPYLVGLEPGGHHAEHFRLRGLQKRQAKPHIGLTEKFILEPEKDLILRAGVEQPLKFICNAFTIFERVAAVVNFNEICPQIPKFLKRFTGDIAVNKAFAANHRFAVEPRSSKGLGNRISGKYVDLHNERLNA